MSDSTPTTPFLNPSENILSLFQSLRTTPPRIIQSPPTQQRRASVALILRMRPAEGLVFQGHEPEGYEGEVIPESDFGLGLGLEDFFRLGWVNHPLTTPELLFIRRAPASTPSGSHARWSSHIAFPGGRHEPNDESALYTAFRETWEEIGIDLAEREFVQVGRLDDREITTSLGKRLLMILSPFVFMQTCPFTPKPDIQATEVSSIHWIPLPSLMPPFSPDRWSNIDIDISTRLSPRNKSIRLALGWLVGKMQFGCVLLPDEPEQVAEGFDVDNEFVAPPEGSGTWYNHREGKRMLRLWGLSLGMTLDLLAHLPSAPQPLVFISSRPTSKNPSPERHPLAFGPRTPVTVTSSFDDHWGAARAAIEEIKDEKEKVNGVNGAGSEGKTPATNGMSGAGMSSQGTLGTKVDVKGMKGRRRRGVGPGVTAVFPRFQYPDVNFWIWVFGRKYRQVVKGWEASTRGPARAADRRTNWSGAALSTFYSAVRQALIVAIILRTIATGLGIGGVVWWLYKRLASKHSGMGEL